MACKTNLLNDVVMIFLTCFLAVGYAAAEEQETAKPIVLRTMGSLFFGGTVTTLENGETFHGDHGYAQYFIPQKARNYPLVMWHGIGQSGRSFETRPDGGEGFLPLLTRQDWAVYVIDQPRRGRAGRTLAPPYDMQAVSTTARESGVWNAFRNGVWAPGGKPTFFEGVQMPTDPASVEQFFRQQTPATGEEQPREELAKTALELLNRTGACVLVTHSASGVLGWHTAMQAPEGTLAAIVAFEPGNTVLPEGETPWELPYANAQAYERQMPQIVSVEAFRKLTRFPILIVWGDHIAKEPSEIFNLDVWRIASTRAKQFVEAVNRHGGDARIVFLPEIGLHGNTHAPFSDRNNREVAALMENFLKEKGLDQNDVPHIGPRPQEREKYTIPLE
ncbi:MAG: alpha/beta fold hydrolase [Planctomycetia bacterium]|nr:alpha/beta fold hydrolase [Planctomycetia bacterium]